MKTTVLRAAAIVIALASIVLAGAPTILAADLIGGRLSVTPQHVTLTSEATIPVAVAMTPDGPFSIVPDHFDLAPGATFTMTIVGTPTGRVSARLTNLSASSEGDTASVTLNVAFVSTRPTPTTTDYTLFAALLLIAALLLVLIVVFARFVRRHVRIVR
jgi:hypothetical protein